MVSLVKTIQLSCLAFILGNESVVVAGPQQRDCQNIRHVHLSVGPDPSTSMIVSFSSTSIASGPPKMGGVLIGKSHQDLNRLVVEKEPAIWYEAMQHHYEKHGNYTSPYQHHVLIEDLEPDILYSYKCILGLQGEDDSDWQPISARFSGSLESDGEPDELFAEEVNEELQNEPKESEQEGSRLRTRGLQMQQQLRRRATHLPYYDSRQCQCPDPNQIRSFRTAPKPGVKPGGKNLKMAVIGDIGQFPHSEETLGHLIRHHGSVVDLVMLAGDLAYTEYDHRRWDTFMDFLDDYPLVDEIPLMITAGNHDIDKAENDTKLFQAYETRFRVPQVKPAEIGTYGGPDGYMDMNDPPYPLPYEYGNAYYSYVYGEAHTIVLSSYSSMEPNSTQYKWFVEELARVDRSVTPWVFCMFHCPIYNTYKIHHQDTQLLAAMQHLEPLMVKNKVNLVINGHVHAYLRTESVSFGQPRKDGPIHIIMGAGGRAAEAEFLNEEPENWVAMRDASLYGYGIIEILNKTHLRWDWVHTGKEADHNSVWHHDDLELPIGGVDGVYLENQYFIKKETRA